MDEPDLEVPLSPELVLVSPDLRERALAEDGNVRPSPSAGPPPVLPAQAPPAPPAQAPPVPPAEPQASPAATASGWRLTVGGATVIALSAFVVFGAGFLISQFVLPGSTTRSVADLQPAPRETTLTPAPRVATPQPPSSPRALRKTVVAATPVPTQQPKPKPKPKPTSPAAPARAPKQTPKPTSPAAPARAPKQTPKTVRPIPGGGYVLPAGRFQVSSNGRTIVNFTLETTCAGQLVLQPIQIEAAGTFVFEGHPTGSPPKTIVRLRGQFGSPTEARGTTEVIGTTCRAPATAFVARLS